MPVSQYSIQLIPLNVMPLTKIRHLHYAIHYLYYRDLNTHCIYGYIISIFLIILLIPS